MSNRIVVVGSKGFIGSSLISYLKLTGSAFLAISRDEFDLLNEKKCKEISNILLPTDVIVFSSAVTPARSSKDVTNSMLMLQNFIDSVSSLTLAGFVLISSDSVYGDFQGMVNESYPYNPNTFHGLSQVAREIILNSSSLKSKTILRLCAVYGKGDTHNSYGPNRCVTQLINKEPIKVFGSVLNVRDHIYIQDVVKIIGLIAQSKISGIFNVASGYTYSFREVALACKDIFRANSIIEFVGSEGPILKKIIDVSKIQELSLDLIPCNLETGLTQWKLQEGKI